MRRACPPLTRDELAATLDSIASVQLPSGNIPSTPGGRTDPWNHVECAMALSSGGRLQEAERAYEWLRSTQRHDGSWANYYRGARIDDPTFDANHCSYIAAGVWHHFAVTGDDGFLADLFPIVERTVEFVLELQQPGGEILWGRDPEGTPWPMALLSSSSCMYFSLRCAIASAERLGLERPDWELSAAQLAWAVQHRPDAFEDKARWSMDWYYPVLSGVVTGDAAQRRIDAGWDEFVVDGLGVRCVSDEPWVTGAETCELALALEGLGRTADALRLFDWVQHLRASDGSYWMGKTYPDGVWYAEERPTWTSAAVVLAADALSGASRASGLFRGDSLPQRLEVPDPVGDWRTHA